MSTFPSLPMLRPLALAVCTLVVGAVGCSADAESETVAEVAPGKSSAGLEQLVGRWQFVYTDARRAAYEAELEKRIDDPAELEKAKRAAVEEAASSVVEYTADQTYISLVGDEEVLRGPFVIAESGPQSLVLVPGNSADCSDCPRISVRFISDSRIAVTDPKKGELIFTRM